MAAPKRYEITTKSAMQWAAAELDHVGRIAAVMDPDIQHAYAMSTLNGMAHLKDALFELVTDPDYKHHHKDLQRTHDAVVRTMRHLVETYELDLDAIRAFNTRGTLSNLGYLNGAADANSVSNAASNASNASNSNSVPNNMSNAMNINNNYQSRNTMNRLQDGGKRKTRRGRALRNRSRR